MNSFISVSKKIDEAILLEENGKIDVAQRLSLIEAQYTKEYSEMLRTQGLSDRDTQLAVWIIETTAFTLMLNIMECCKKCVKLMQYHPRGCAPNKLVSILGLIQAIMADNLFKSIRDELCVEEDVISQFNNLCVYAQNNLENYEGSMSVEDVQEQINNLKMKRYQANAIVDYVRDGIEPVNPDTGEKLTFSLNPEQIAYIESHPDKFSERLIAFSYLYKYANAYNDKGPDIFDKAPQEAENNVRTYCKYILAHRDESLDFIIHFAFVSTVMHFPAFLYNGVGFVPPDLLNTAILFIISVGKDNLSTLDYILDLRDSAGRFMCMQPHEDPSPASQDTKQRNWYIVFKYIESLAKQFGWKGTE